MASKSYSKGICWIDDCRIPFANSADADYTLSAKYTTDIEVKQTEDWGTKKMGNVSKEQGRFPANILVCDDMLNDGKKYGNLFNTNRNKDVDGGTGNSLVRAHKQGESNGICDNGISSSRFYDIDKWFDKILND